jgi:hypothetical protein
MLERLGCAREAVEPDAWRVTPPSWRFDLGIEEDLIEEVARLHGFEHIGSSVPNDGLRAAGGDPTHRRCATRWSRTASSRRSLRLHRRRRARRGPRAAPSVRLAEPQGVERAVMRTALYPGLLRPRAPEPRRARPGAVRGGPRVRRDERERVALLLRGRGSGALARRGRGRLLRRQGRARAARGALRRALELRPAPFPTCTPARGGRASSGTAARSGTWGACTRGRGGVRAGRDLRRRARSAARRRARRRSRRCRASRSPSATWPWSCPRRDVRRAARAPTRPATCWSASTVRRLRRAAGGADHKSVALRFRFRHARAR